MIFGEYMLQSVNCAYTHSDTGVKLRLNTLPRQLTKNGFI